MKTRLPNLFLRAGFAAALTLCWVLLPEGEMVSSSANPALDPDERFVLESGQATGRLSFEILEDKTGVHLPGRLYFAHQEPGDQLPTVGRFENFLVTASGREIKTVPVGEYDVYITRGTEFTLDHQQISIKEGQLTHLKSTLSQAIDTSGFISADFHLHLQFAMRDGAIVTAAEGLDFLTATDHNILKDYAPYIAELNLQRFMTSVVGSEIDTTFGHFNSFPLTEDRWQERGYRHSIRTPREFLRTVREDPGDEIVQINHPRYDNPKGGYFNLRLNRESSQMEYPFFETAFDQLEVYNAAVDCEDMEAPSYGPSPQVDQNLKDWFGLLNQGIAIAGVANTDAHRYPSQLPGYPRNYVLSDTDKPWEVDPSRVVNALKKRASTASLGPFIRFSANDGQVVGSTFSSQGEPVTLHVNDQAAPWIPVDRVQIIANGEVLHTFPVDESSERIRLRKAIRVQSDHDTWYLVLVTSERPWKAPFTDFRSLAFTNPIWVDNDGNGYFDPIRGGDPGWVDPEEEQQTGS